VFEEKEGGRRRRRRRGELISMEGRSSRPSERLFSSFERGWGCLPFQVDLDLAPRRIEEGRMLETSSLRETERERRGRGKERKRVGSQLHLALLPFVYNFHGSHFARECSIPPSPSSASFVPLHHVLRSTFPRAQQLPRRSPVGDRSSSLRSLSGRVLCSSRHVLRFQREVVQGFEEPRVPWIHFSSVQEDCKTSPLRSNLAGRRRILDSFPRPA